MFLFHLKLFASFICSEAKIKVLDVAYRMLGGQAPVCLPRLLKSPLPPSFPTLLVHVTTVLPGSAPGTLQRVISFKPHIHSRWLVLFLKQENQSSERLSVLPSVEGTASLWDPVQPERSWVWVCCCCTALSSIAPEEDTSAVMCRELEDFPVCPLTRVTSSLPTLLCVGFFSTSPPPADLSFLLALHLIY